eukprot:COSAG05_NODE_887_length_6737_cov_25.085719_3_plen_96_part_00
MMREAKIDTIVQVLIVPVQMYAVVSIVVSSCTRLYRYTGIQLYVGRKIADESITSDVRWITSSKLQTSRSRRQNLRNTRLVSREFHLCQSQDSER